MLEIGDLVIHESDRSKEQYRWDIGKVTEIIDEVHVRVKWNSNYRSMIEPNVEPYHTIAYLIGLKDYIFEGEMEYII